MTHVNFLKDPKATKAKKHKKRTNAEVDYMRRVAELPCCAKGCGRNECEAHHIRDALVGKGMKSGDYETIPLCLECHHDFHHGSGRKLWEVKYGNQREHVKQTQKELGYEE